MPTNVWAQLNESDTLDFRANLALTGFYQGGNVQTLIFRTKSEISYKPISNWIFKSRNSYVYQEFGKQKADVDILSLNFLYLNPQKKFYPLLLGFVSSSFRREIDLRYLLGAGFTYQVLTTKNHWLKLAITSEYEHTDFSKTVFNRAQYDGNRSINTFRGTVWVNGSYSLFEKKIILNHEFYVQPSLEESDNYRWQADIGLEFPLWQFLNFKINYLQTFESIVVTNQKQDDSILTVGFTLKSY